MSQDIIILNVVFIFIYRNNVSHLNSVFLDLYVLLWYNFSTMKEQIHIYIEKEIKEKLEKLAEKDGRSLNNLINKVLRDFVTGKKSKIFNPSTDVGFMLMNKEKEDDR